MDIDAKIHNEYVTNLAAQHNVAEMSEEEAWHFNRRMGMGGSDIGAILGLNPYKTPLQVWKEKVGEVGPDQAGEAAYWGTQLEPVVAQEYTKRTGHKIQRINRVIHHADMPWMAANIDRIIWQNGKAPVVKNKIRSKHLLECKTASPFAKEWGEENTDEIPHSYWLQCTWYLATLNADICDVALLKGGQQYLQYRVERNPQVETMMIERARQFWVDHVIAGVPPEPTALNEVNEFFKKDNGQSVLADHETQVSIEKLKELKSKIKALEKLADVHETKIKKCLGEAANLIDNHGNKIATWKAQNSNRFDGKGFKAAHPALAKKFMKQNQSRVFRL
ncbi:YqaJ viral recombinase family protein [Endozoicomonas sp. SM1973]|uniref:YqaJ viral recombinase family protein n=1 Tax=Spartinivicinus marinus TaxID=2994442 RepID=A0A853IMF2_9GAMM|nr:YqaJ viral recombinase family protein [Spartinivicinus marinus]MCX4025080.1 YqaJ viral recombinase family protein [Spartinivicinus marinus]NYZ68966.1 YqaJ viral recombinase family protein [Spartinivicinus marinus]